MDVDPNVIKRLKKRNFPENWEKGRSERVRMKTHFLHKNALETYEQTLIIQQNLLLEITEQLAKLICEKAENCLLDDRVAMEGLLECMREARRLYLPLQDQFTCKRCNKKWDST
ncbi:MAG: hypothetical protein KDD46_06505 [Bdellovibrionales bacterium]|nr:hypothetical protein [Bdellovibrionales bacterium]